MIGITFFPSVLVLFEMQAVSFKIWTRVDVTISYDDIQLCEDKDSNQV